MTYYQPLEFQLNKHPGIDRTKICPHCLGEYELGITGTVDGCDECEQIIRNADGTINMSAYTETFIIETTGEEIPTTKPQCICLEYIGDNGPCPVEGHTR